MHLSLPKSHHVWHAWLTSDSGYLTAAPNDFCDEHCHEQTLKRENSVALTTEMRVCYGVLLSPSCRTKVLCTKSFQRDVDPREEEEEGRLRTKCTIRLAQRMLEDQVIIQLRSWLISPFHASAQHNQEGFPVLAAKRGAWSHAAYGQDVMERRQWHKRGYRITEC